MPLRRRKGGLDGAELSETWQPKLWLVLVTLALIAAYLVAFVAENTKQVSVHFVFTAARISLIASHLGEGPRKRPRYEVLETFSLGG